MKSYEQIAKAMYAAYRRHIQTTIGVNPPAWGTDLPNTERQAWIAAAKAAASPVAPNWKWMTHPSHNNGNPIPVFVFVEQGVTYYRPFDTEATEFEWELRDDEWAEFAAPQQQADALDAQRYRWLRAQPLESDSSMFCITIWRKGTDGFGDDLRLEKLDAAIDAAIAAAKEI